MPDPVPCPADDSLWMASDRQVFIDHPEMSRFARAAIPHELCQPGVCNEKRMWGKFNMNAPHHTMVVIQLREGVRARQPMLTHKPCEGPTNIEGMPILNGFPS